MSILSLVTAILAMAPWLWPVDGPHDVLRPFIPPAHAYGPGHRGVDLAAPGGMLRAPADGVVHFAGVVVDRPVLSIDHGGGVLSSYEPVETSLTKGDAVARGQVIGSVIDGHCSVTCVHLGVRVDGQYVSPLRFLGGIPRAVLLPTRALPGTASGAERLPSRDELLAKDAHRFRPDAVDREQLALRRTREVRPRAVAAATAPDRRPCRSPVGIRWAAAQARGCASR